MPKTVFKERHAKLIQKKTWCLNTLSPKHAFPPEQTVHFNNISYLIHGDGDNREALPGYELTEIENGKDEHNRRKTIITIKSELDVATREDVLSDLLDLYGPGLKSIKEQAFDDNKLAELALALRQRVLRKNPKDEKDTARDYFNQIQVRLFELHKENPAVYDENDILSHKTSLEALEYLHPGFTFPKIG